MPGHIAPAYVAADANTLSTGSHGEMFEKLLRRPSGGVSGRSGPGGWMIGCGVHWFTVGLAARVTESGKPWQEGAIYVAIHLGRRCRWVGRLPAGHFEESGSLSGATLSHHEDRMDFALTT